MQIENLLTEKRNPASLDLDTLSTHEIVALINDEDKQIAHAVRNKLDDIVKMVDAIHLNLLSGGRLIYIGAGTSGRLGVLDASECPPTFGVSEDQIKAIIAGGDSALRIALEDAEDDSAQGAKDIALQKIGESDAVIGIAASGRTPYTIGAMIEAKKRGAATACIVCTTDSEMETVADFPIVIETGPEVLTGSTRMKAGTAQKMVLNMISTATMVKLGKVYSNLMVDVVPSNDKLRKRAALIVAEAAGVKSTEAENALLLYGSPKKAIAGLMTSADKTEIERVLHMKKGHLRETLTYLKSFKGGE